MLLAIDVGNTNIVLGLFNQSTLLETFRFKTDADRSVDEYAVLFKSALREKARDTSKITKCLICSVVPQLTARLSELFKTYFEIEAILIGPGIKTGISIQTVEPVAVGADRVVNALAAKTLYSLPAIVIDIGTATTFDYVDLNGSYRGGIIAPGPMVSLDALVSKTAKLPRIDLHWPPSVIGNSTVTAMQSGMLFGYLSMIEGLIHKVTAEIKSKPTVIATGGFSALFENHTKAIDYFDMNLTLKGIELVSRLN